MFALADGLMIRTLLNPERSADAVATIEYHLDRIFDHGATQTAT